MNARRRIWFRSIIMLLSLPLMVGQGCPPLGGGGDGDGDGDGDGATTTTGNSAATGKYLGAAEPTDTELTSGDPRRKGCETCHTRHYDNWMTTAHSGALETLEAIGQGENAVCLACHTVGFGEAGGFVDRETTNALAGVGCEACHGAAADHAADVTNESIRPDPTPIEASVCGKCHTDAHHPTVDEWEESGHAGIQESIANRLVAGSRVNSCGKCHSGDVRIAMVQAGYTDLDADHVLPENLVEVEGLDPDDEAAVAAASAALNPIVCTVCHNPHKATGNNADADEEHQLRYPEVVSLTPSNAIDDVTNPDRYNLCGQCHHSRGRAWDATSRGPHHSVQSNMFFGEVPVPDGEAALVSSAQSAHAFAPKQCVTCHMYMEDKDSPTDENPNDTGHKFELNFNSCAAACHNHEGQNMAARVAARQAETEDGLEAIVALLGDPSTWEYKSGGGPSDQSGISDAVKKARFIYHYIESDGSGGVHNFKLTDKLLNEARFILLSE